MRPMTEAALEAGGAGPHAGALERRGTGARLVVLHEGFQALPAAAVEHAAGWERVLGWLEAYARRVRDEEEGWR